MKLWPFSKRQHPFPLLDNCPCRHPSEQHVRIGDQPWRCLACERERRAGR